MYTLVLKRTVFAVFGVLLTMAASWIPVKGIFQLLVFLIPYFYAAFPILQEAVRTASNKKLPVAQAMILGASALTMIISAYGEAVFMLLIYRFSDAMVLYLTSKKGIRCDSKECNSVTERIAVAVTNLLPIVMAVVALLVTVIFLIIDISAWRYAIYRGVAIIAIATSIGITSSVVKAFSSAYFACKQDGITIKGNRVLELLSKCTTFVFSKNGVLTDSRIEVIPALPDTISAEKLLELVCLAESCSSHPIARAVRGCAKGTLDKALLTDAREVEHLGVIAKIGGKMLVAGSSALLAKLNIQCPSTDDDRTVVHTALDGVYLGCIVIHDDVREGTGKALYRLKSSGVKSMVMLTGDKVGGASGAAELMPEINEFRHSLTADGKANAIAELISDSGENEILTYVSADPEDAKAFARADVSVSMGTECAELCNVVIEDASVEKLSLLYNTAEKTVIILKENIALCLIAKVVLLLMIIFIPLRITYAAMLDLIVTIIAIYNSARITLSSGDLSSPFKKLLSKLRKESSKDSDDDDNDEIILD